MTTHRKTRLNRIDDRPPIGRFLLLFTALIAVALGLAALSNAATPGEGGTAATDVRESPPDDGARRAPAAGG